MLRELIYLGCGIEKRITKRLKFLIEDGKKEYGDKDLFEIGKEHLSKRKEQIKSLLLSDLKEVTDEIGIATKKDIEDLKEHFKG